MIGERFLHTLPYSEVCIFMKVAGQTMSVAYVNDHAVQLYEHGLEFSFPITCGEAGLPVLELVPA